MLYNIIQQNSFCRYQTLKGNDLYVFSYFQFIIATKAVDLA